jgi:hypothetical protein
MAVCTTTSVYNPYSSDGSGMDHLKTRIATLTKNLSILLEREAKYGGNAPVDLLNQIDDHEQAIACIEQTLAGQLTPAQLAEALAPLNIDPSLIPPPRLLASPPDHTAEKLAAYRQAVLAETQYVNLQGVPLPSGMDRLAVPLDRVYIQLQAVAEETQRRQRQAETEALETQARGEMEREPGRSTYAWLATLRLLGEQLYRQGQTYEAEQRPKPVDPGEAVQKHKRLVILGAPGAGKSTLLRYLACHAAKQPDGLLPLRVSLRDYATSLTHNPERKLREFALDRADGGDPGLRQALEVTIETGRVLWLVDALDEAHGWGTAAAEQVGRLSGQVVLTSRPIGYPRGLEALPHFEVLPLTPANVE